MGYLSSCLKNNWTPSLNAQGRCSPLCTTGVLQRTNPLILLKEMVFHTNIHASPHVILPAAVREVTALVLHTREMSEWVSAEPRFHNRTLTPEPHFSIHGIRCYALKPSYGSHRASLAPLIQRLTVNTWKTTGIRVGANIPHYDASQS